MFFKSLSHLEVVVGRFQRTQDVLDALHFGGFLLGRFAFFVLLRLLIGLLGTSLFGIVGLPVFADRAHGLDVVLGATGGYLLGFILAAVVVGWLAQRQWDRRFSSAVTAMLTGTVIIYVCGLAWLKQDQGLDLATTLEYGLYPFVPGDLLKLYLAGALLPGAWRLLGRLRG